MTNEAATSPLPQVLKYLPSDKAQDARNFMVSLQYWLGGNSENLENFLLNLASQYVPALKGVDLGKVGDAPLGTLFPVHSPLALSPAHAAPRPLNGCLLAPDLAPARPIPPGSP